MKKEPTFEDLADETTDLEKDWRLESACCRMVKAFYRLTDVADEIESMTGYQIEWLEEFFATNQHKQCLEERLRQEIMKYLKHLRGDNGEASN